MAQYTLLNQWLTVSADRDFTTQHFCDKLTPSLTDRPLDVICRLWFTAPQPLHLYLCASLYLWLQLRQHPELNRKPLIALAALALLCHGIASYSWIATDAGLDFGLLPMSTAIFFSINLIVLISSLRKPLQNLFLGLFPVTALVLVATEITERSPELSVSISTGLSLHIVLSVLAYSLLTIASCHALLLAWQNWRLHHKHLRGWLQTTMPPLQTMEELLFEILWCGFILLTLSLLVGVYFYR